MVLPRLDTFMETLQSNGIDPHRRTVDLLQLNITKKCNQACAHCHINAGPQRTEEMSVLTMNRLFLLLGRNHHIKTVDITGGAPELNTNFKYLVKTLRELKVNIIDRCNLTVLFEQGQEDTAEFLAKNGVMIVASLPCYTESNVDSQRGSGVYLKSIKALQILNALGYGREGSGLLLNLVYNPLGDYLPGDQKDLQEDYKKELQKEHGIVFNELYTITNMPINRFEEKLKIDNKLKRYHSLLAGSFNRAAADNVMCKNQISVGWDGQMYDCDFNQALNLPISSQKDTIWKIKSFTEITERITYGQHCFACTAGCGSSCQGKLV